MSCTWSLMPLGLVDFFFRTGWGGGLAGIGVVDKTASTAFEAFANDSWWAKVSTFASFGFFPGSCISSLHSSFVSFKNALNDFCVEVLLAWFFFLECLSMALLPVCCCCWCCEDAVLLTAGYWEGNMTGFSDSSWKVTKLLYVYRAPITSVLLGLLSSAVVG